MIYFVFLKHLNTTLKLSEIYQVVIGIAMESLVVAPLPNNVELSGNYNQSQVVKADKYGWFKIQPKFLQRFLSAKWALFWLCWAGAMQGLFFDLWLHYTSIIVNRFYNKTRYLGETVVYKSINFTSVWKL